MRLFFILIFGVCFSLSTHAENLFKDDKWVGLTTDRRASNIGDSLVVVVYQTAEALNSSQRSTRRGSSYGYSIGSEIVGAGGFGNAKMDGQFRGEGRIQRSEKFVTQLSVRISEILPNGDFRVAGIQKMDVNGEQTEITVQGVVRPFDINSKNQVLSTKIVDAQISYDGKGFVSRGSSQGPIQFLFSLLGLG